MPTTEDFTSPKYGQTSLVNLKKKMEITDIDYFPVNTLMMADNDGRNI